MQSETLRQLQNQYELLLRDGDPASRASAWQTIVDMKVNRHLVVSWHFIVINTMAGDPPEGVNTRYTETVR